MLRSLLLLLCAYMTTRDKLEKQLGGRYEIYFLNNLARSYLLEKIVPHCITWYA